MKSKILKSVFGIKSNQQKSTKKQDPSFNRVFEDNLISDSCTKSILVNHEFDKQCIESLFENMKLEYQNKVDDDDDFNEFPMNILGKTLISINTDLECSEITKFIEIYANVNVSLSIEKLAQQTNLLEDLTDSLTSYFNESNEVSQLKEQTLNILKISEELSKKNNQHEKSISSNKKLSSSKNENDQTNVGESIKKELKRNEKKLSHEIEDLEFHLINLYRDQSTIASVFINELEMYKNYHDNCANIISQKYEIIQNITSDILLRPFLGISLRDLSSLYDTEVSIFLVVAVEFLIDNNVVNCKNVFQTNICDEKFNSFTTKLQSGCLDYNEFKNDLNIVAYGVLLYLDKLPSSLIQLEKSIDWQEIDLNAPYVVRCHKLLCIVDSLPYLNRINLLYIFSFYHFLIKNCQQNTYNSAELSTILMAYIFPKDYINPSNYNQIKICLADILENFSSLFPTEYNLFDFEQKLCKISLKKLNCRLISSENSINKEFRNLNSTTANIKRNSSSSLLKVPGINSKSLRHSNSSEFSLKNCRRFSFNIDKSDDNSSDGRVKTVNVRSDSFSNFVGSSEKIGDCPSKYDEVCETIDNNNDNPNTVSLNKSPSHLSLKSSASIDREKSIENNEKLINEDLCEYSGNNGDNHDATSSNINITLCNNNVNNSCKSEDITNSGSCGNMAIASDTIKSTSSINCSTSKHRINDKIRQNSISVSKICKKFEGSNDKCRDANGSESRRRNPSLDAVYSSNDERCQISQSGFMSIRDRIQKFQNYVRKDESNT